jgi:hypothetical protein
MLDMKTTQSSNLFAEIGFAEEETPITEAVPSAEEQTFTTIVLTNTENIANTNEQQNAKEEQPQLEDEEIKDQKLGRGDKEQLGPDWQRTDFEEGQLWIQCKPPSIKVFLVLDPEPSGSKLSGMAESGFGSGSTKSFGIGVEVIFTCHRNPKFIISALQV